MQERVSLRQGRDPPFCDYCSKLSPLSLCHLRCCLYPFSKCCACSALGFQKEKWATLFCAITSPEINSSIPAINFIILFLQNYFREGRKNCKKMNSLQFWEIIVNVVSVVEIFPGWLVGHFLEYLYQVRLIEKVSFITTLCEALVRMVFPVTDKMV